MSKPTFAYELFIETLDDDSPPDAAALQTMLETLLGDHGYSVVVHVAPLGEIEFSED